jgi:CDP-diacylglycerol--serine O-phosphatidyltransferase
LRKADIVTLTGGALAAASLAIALYGSIEWAVRLLFLSYAMDVIDGWVARKFDASDPRGQLLDRSLDRFSQIIVPGVLLVESGIPEKFTLGQYSIVAYLTLMIPYSFYRLAYRRVSDLSYFPGAPLFTHTLVMLGIILSEEQVHPAILLVLALFSILPVKYARRGSSVSSPAVWPRFIALLVLALLPYDTIVMRILGEIMLYAGLLYALAGWIPYYWAKSRERHQ